MYIFKLFTVSEADITHMLRVSSGQTIISLIFNICKGMYLYIDRQYSKDALNNVLNGLENVLLQKSQKQ